MEDVTPSQFPARADVFIGKTVNHVWRGAGTAVFLELGALRNEPSKRHPSGELTIMIEWSWRVEGPRSIRFGSFSTDRKIDLGLATLQGRKVKAIVLFGRLCELSVALSGDRWVNSFSTVEGQPEWTLFFGKEGWLRVTRGRVAYEKRHG